MSKTGISDRDIINCIRSGRDTSVLERLYEDIFPKIKKYIRKNSGSEDDAFDIFQDGVVIFYNYVVSGRYKENYEISGFLYTVCKNLWINKAKHNRLHIRLNESIETLGDNENVLNMLISKEREKEVQDVLSLLGDRCRELLQYAFFYQLSSLEICEKMGFANEDTLKTKKYKCKQRLLEIMKNKGFENG